MGRSAWLLGNVRLLRWAVMATLFLAVPGLVQLTAEPARAEPAPPVQPVIPVQMTGSAQGRPTLTDASATMAKPDRPAGPVVKPK